MYLYKYLCRNACERICINTAHIQKPTRLWSHEMNVKIAFNLLTDQTSNFTAYMGAIRWGTRGTRPPTFSDSGDIICQVPHIFLFRFGNRLVSHQAVPLTFYNKIALETAYNTPSRWIHRVKIARRFPLWLCWSSSEHSNSYSFTFNLVRTNRSQRPLSVNSLQRSNSWWSKSGRNKVTAAAGVQFPHLW